MVKRSGMRRRKIAAAGLAIAMLMVAVGCQRGIEEEASKETAVIVQEDETPKEMAVIVQEDEQEDKEESGPLPEKSAADLPMEDTQERVIRAETPEEWTQEAAFPSENVEAARAEGFVELAEAVPDVIQEIRYYSTYNFVGERIDGYDRPVALLTKEAASALKLVSDDVMEQGYRLKVYDAYRPQKAVDHFVRWAKDSGDTRMKSYFYPEIDKSRLFDQGYISARSGHSRGSTVDLTLFDMKTGKEVDMGGVFDYFGRISHPDYVGELTKEQQDNRNILREAMMRHGFKPISTEWWHFTLREEPYPNTYFDFSVH